MTRTAEQETADQERFDLLAAQIARAEVPISDEDGDFLCERIRRLVAQSRAGTISPENLDVLRVLIQQGKLVVNRMAVEPDQTGQVTEIKLASEPWRRP